MDYVRTAAYVPFAALQELYEIPNWSKLLSFISLQTLAAAFHRVVSDPNTLFVSIVALRYYRLIFHVLSYVFLYKPAAVPCHPLVSAKDVHIILPTIDPDNAEFEKCIQSCLEQRPGNLTVVTVGKELVNRCEIVLSDICYPNGTTTHAFPATKIAVENASYKNKRAQVKVALDKLAAEKEKNKNTIVVLVDDHVWWPSDRFLQELLAPFEDSKVGFVGTNKRVARERGNSFKDSLLNFIAALYLERHNFEIRATNAIDGGVFVVSGRTSAIRAEIVMDDEFRHRFVNEMFFFNKFGPLNADDDNLITRWVVSKGYNIKIQFNDHARIETTLGTVGGYTKFYGQLLRWARTTWRSNSCSLFTERTVWFRQPWCLHAVYFTSFVNFALIWDPLLIYLWSRTTNIQSFLFHPLLLILGSKLIKLLPYFWRYPLDFPIFFPFYLLFVYVHSIIKLMALLTFYNVDWSGRQLDSGSQTSASDSDHDHTEDDGAAPDNGDDFDLQHLSLANSHGRHNHPRSSWTTDAAHLRLRRRTANIFDTPYGPVTHVNPASTPTNVRESSHSRTPSPALRLSPQRGLSATPPNIANDENFKTPRASAAGLLTPPTTVRGPSPVSLTDNLTAPPPPKSIPIILKRQPQTPYSRDFQRIDSCARLHGEGTSLKPRSGKIPSRCAAIPIRNLPVGYIVPGHPRF